jgi:hypothetical protein
VRLVGLISITKARTGAFIFYVSFAMAFAAAVSSKRLFGSAPAAAALVKAANRQASPSCFLNRKLIAEVFIDL